METNFPEIETLANSALDERYQNPKIERSYKMLAGFRVPNPTQEAELIGEERRKVNGLRQKTQEIRTKLERHGITPLAVIPSEMWDRICEKARLDKFQPDLYGQVRVSTEDAKYFITAGRIASPMLWLTPWVGLGLWGLVVLPRNPGLWFAALVGLVAINIFGWATVNSASLSAKKSLYTLAHKYLTVGLSKFYDVLPRRWVLTRITQKPLSSHTRHVTLVLPPAPDEIVSILERTTKVYSTINIAVQPGGYSLAESPSQVIRGRLMKSVETHAYDWSRWRAQNLDPIIYVSENGVTAIIAQFGPFAIEREAVEAALAVEDEQHS